jgi:hypothetical protein
MVASSHGTLINYFKIKTLMMMMAKMKRKNKIKTIILNLFVKILLGSLWDSRLALLIYPTSNNSPLAPSKTESNYGNLELKLILHRKKMPILLKRIKLKRKKLLKGEMTKRKEQQATHFWMQSKLSAGKRKWKLKMIFQS